LFTFFLDKKSNKKIKANPIAPLDLPGQRTSYRTIGLIIQEEQLLSSKTFSPRTFRQLLLMLRLNLQTLQALHPDCLAQVAI